MCAVRWAVRCAARCAGFSPRRSKCSDHDLLKSYPKLSSALCNLNKKSFFCIFASLMYVGWLPFWQRNIILRVSSKTLHALKMLFLGFFVETPFGWFRAEIIFGGLSWVPWSCQMLDRPFTACQIRRAFYRSFLTTFQSILCYTDHLHLKYIN